MSTIVLTNSRRDSIASVHHKRKIRMLLWGGASNPGDNSAFEFAKGNTARDYKSLDKGNLIIVDRRIRVAKDVVTIVNAQEEGSIRSLDIWTHGGAHALYLTTAEPPPSKDSGWATQKLYQIRRLMLQNSSLYRSSDRLLLHGAGWVEGSALIADIKFSKFTVNAKVELHGCRTADASSSRDNIAADMSLRLHEAGKNLAIVIGHADKANPNIKGGGETLAEQDYRHGQRVVFNGGRPVKTTSQKGFIPEPKAEP